MKSKFTWIFTLLLAFFIQLSFAQQKTITGVVTDPSGMPIPGVTVMVEGQAPGVQTDFDGNYSINAAVGQKLVFSFIGMATQTFTVGAANTISVQMQEDVMLLNEVVVEAYRNTTKRTSNIAAVTVTAKGVENRPSANFIQSLQGQVSGLNILTGSGQPGSSSTVILRGVATVTGNVEPLYVIDGMQFTADNFRSLNPNDIESISVLKDAGATAIYGNRGANGAIIVTTKKGSFEQGLQIRYSGQSGFTFMQNNKYHKMNSRELLTLEKQANAGLGAALSDAQIAAYDIDTDWYDQFFRTGVSQSHTLSLTSGGKNSSSFTSLGYFNQEGILRGTGLQRFTFRSNVTGKSANDRFNYSTALTLNYSQRNEASNLGQGSVNINPVLGANNGAPYISPSWYTNGKDLFDWYGGQAPAFAPTTDFGVGVLSLSPLMLMDRLKTGVNRSNELKLIGTITGSYKLTDDLSVGTIVGLDMTENMLLAVQDANSFNSFVFQNPGEDFLGFETQRVIREFNAYVNTRLTYAKTFAEKHNIEVSAFTEYNKNHYKAFAYTQNGLDPKTYSPGAGTGYVPFAPDTSPFYVPDVSASKITAGLFSYFATADYDYNERYGLGLSIRRDASNRFSGSNRWGTFWSVSGRWNIDQEAFMQGSMFDMLKLRASYGKSGNQNIQGASQFTAVNNFKSLYATTTGYQGAPAYALSQLGVSDLRWENVYQANVGLDFQLLDKKLRGSFDVYRKRTEDLYLNKDISAVSGTNQVYANYGTLDNKGIETQLSYDVFSGNDFNLTVNFNGSYNKNTFLDVSDPEGLVDNGTTAYAEGASLDEFYLIRYAGVNPVNGNLLFYDANGAITENPNPETDKVLTGKNYIPRYQGGFGFEASYKGFFLNSQFAFVAKVWRMDYDLANLQDATDIGVFNKSTDMFRAWTPDNRVTDIPSLFATNLGYSDSSDRYLKDASYLRLKNVSFGYQVPKDFLKGTFMTSVKAFVQGENLFTWTKWRGWDADSNRDLDVYQYPTPRVFSVGLDVQF